MDVFVYVLEERCPPTTMSTAVTAAGLALVDGGVPMLDLIIGAEAEAAQATDNLTVGYLPNLEQLESIHFDGGLMTAEDASLRLDALAEECRRAQADIRNCLASEVEQRE